jgi:hypothetical protein
MILSLSLSFAGSCRPAEEPVPPPTAGEPAGQKAAVASGRPEAKLASPEPIPPDAWVWSPKPQGAPKVLLTAYFDGFISGRTEDRDVTAGGRTFRLSRLRTWSRDGAGVVLPIEGEPIEGTLDGLKGLELTVGGRSHRPELIRASRVDFEADEALAPAPGLESLRQGRFIRPVPSRSPVTSFLLAPGGAKAVESLDTTRCRVQLVHNEIIIHTFAQKTRDLDLNVQLWEPSGRALETGKLYQDPGTRTKFVIWEASDRIAVDYASSRENGPAGSVRLNSSYR